VDAAVLAEIMLRPLGAELIQAEHAIAGLNMELRLRHPVRQDQRAPSGAERTVAAQAARDGLALKRKLDRAAVAASLVHLHDHVIPFSVLRSMLDR
jgi:hypothetical protein